MDGHFGVDGQQTRTEPHDFFAFLPFTDVWCAKRSLAGNVERAAQVFKLARILLVRIPANKTLVPP